ncbi:hypothetical protein DM02DRAFT_615862 [Periconia macrospinosa]|uniref:Secreted protein n=1 Tax=Periconia macrospinosa TaxID=97972 RepID=A0A2V1DKL0_9PLEO|nr:hypothetical protein DM02DRAFT_615862 [Periconia macrospinosa]
MPCCAVLYCAVLCCAAPCGSTWERRWIDCCTRLCILDGQVSVEAVHTPPGTATGFAVMKKDPKHDNMIRKKVNNSRRPHLAALVILRPGP